jgi:hypothetical protein
MERKKFFKERLHQDFFLSFSPLLFSGMEEEEEEEEWRQ